METEMEQPLANLARAQDELRNALSANLGELRSAHDGVAAAAANALRERRREREESRTALEREASERARLETKLTQCETALRETKAALGEARSEAKEANQQCAQEIRDLTQKLQLTLEEKKKNEDALKQHGQELKQQLIIMQTKLERAGEMDKVKEEQFAQQENRHKDTVEEFKKAQTELKLQLHDALAKIEAEHKGMKVQEAEVLKQRDVINRLEAKNASLIAELDNTRAQCVQWQRETDMAKAEMQQARSEAEAAKEERMKEEKHRGIAENETADSRRKAAEATALAADEKQTRKLADQALEAKQNELKDLKHKAQMMEKDYKEMLTDEKQARAQLEENYETLKQDSVNLYNAYTSSNQQIEEYRIALEREAQEAAALHAALAKQKEDAARDAVRSRSTRVIAPPAGFLGGSSPSPKQDGRRGGARIGEMDDIRSPPSFAD